MNGFLKIHLLEASSDQEQDRASAGHDDDWEMASEVSMNENEFDAFKETIDNDTTDGTGKFCIKDAQICLLLL